MEGKSRGNLECGKERSPKHTMMTLNVRPQLINSELCGLPFLLLIWNREVNRLSGKVPDHSLDVALSL